MIEIKRLNCGSCMELRRIKIRNGVEPDCPTCGPTTWLALPRLEESVPRAVDFPGWDPDSGVTIYEFWFTDDKGNIYRRYEQ